MSTDGVGTLRALALEDEPDVAEWLLSTGCDLFGRSTWRDDISSLTARAGRSTAICAVSGTSSGRSTFVAVRPDVAHPGRFWCSVAWTGDATSARTALTTWLGRVAAARPVHQVVSRSRVGGPEHDLVSSERWRPVARLNRHVFRDGDHHDVDILVRPAADLASDLGTATTW